MLHINKSNQQLLVFFIEELKESIFNNLINSFFISISIFTVISIFIFISISIFIMILMYHRFIINIIIELIIINKNYCYLVIFGSLFHVRCSIYDFLYFLILI